MDISRYIIPFDQCDHGDRPRVGGKCISLAAMIRAGAPVPPGFAVTTDAYNELQRTDNLRAKIHAQLEQLNYDDVAGEEQISQTIRRLIEETPLPAAIEAAIRQAYAKLSAQCNIAELPVAVRSSATAEDLPGASFAGQQDTYLWVVGADAVVKSVRKCWSSLYTARAIAYRHDNGFAHEKVLMSVGVQISSATFYSGSPQWLHYVTSKGGIIGMTRAMARELGDYGITVNAIAPGFTLTEASLGLIENAAGYGIKRGAIKRGAQAADIVGTVLYLASPASDFVTGQTIIVDGGRQFN